MHPASRYIETYTGSDASAQEQFQQLTKVIAEILAYPVTGTITFPGAGTVNVTFNRPLKTANYQVIATADAAEFLWATGKSTTGFTLNSTAGGSTATASWVIFQ